MTEHEARQLCINRGRDPDRDMSGPDGPLKAWHTYMHPMIDAPHSRRSSGAKVYPQIPGMKYGKETEEEATG